MQKRISLGIALSLFTACTTDEAPVVTTNAVDQEIARLTERLADVPGELVVTHASELPFSPELEERVATAGKVIHVDSDDHVEAYIGREMTNLPEGVPAHRTFKALDGDVVIAEQELLSTYLAQRDPAKSEVASATALVVGDGKQWPESTVAFTINDNLQGTDRQTVLSAISAWNAAVDVGSNQQKVRFVPRYWKDDRPYVDFTKVDLPEGICGQSMVGRHDWFGSLWFSHSIEIDTDPNCMTRRTIQHEMGHTAGLNHEHQRCDRDQFVNVASGDSNCARICGGDSSDFGPYNYLSVMHYQYGQCGLSQRVPATSNFRGQPTNAGTASQLDAGDVQGLNSSYVNRPALPPIGPSKFYTFTPAHAPNKVVQIPLNAPLGGQLIISDRIGVPREEFFLMNDGTGTVRIQTRQAFNQCLASLVNSNTNGTTNGTPVIFATCNGSNAQRWIVAPNAGSPFTFDIINVLSGKAMDVVGNGTANGTPIQQYDHSNFANQRFTLTQVF